MKRYMPLAVVIVFVTLAAGVYALDFTSRVRTVDGISVGEVVLGDQVPIRIRYSAGGLGPGERAEVMANRLSQIDNLQPADITVGRVGPYWAVLARGQLIATADPMHADANRTSTYGLAIQWRNQLRTAISQQTGSPTPPLGAGSDGQALYPRTAQKVVPIISVGSGLRIGAAIVAGSSQQVARVNAVAQLEGQLGSRVRLRALVPIDTENIVGNLRRVPGTSVIGVADIDL
ncbi:MAG TPA: hypothetical protein PLU88_08475 [Armatimonadota bacterium]|mgnify:CR=1 FL=1|jgi:hypothetical protein|nr:hypothetical protein [Armatimonadota bacterium]